MQALAASCEELRARTGKPPLNVLKQKFKELMNIAEWADWLTFG
jgi:hypothetical protein